MRTALGPAFAPALGRAGRRARSAVLAIAPALVLLAAPAAARAADIAVLGFTQGSATASRTLRVPATGTFDAVTRAQDYVAVGVAISDVSYTVQRVAWVLDPPGSRSQVLEPQSLRSSLAEMGADCRSELWGASIGVPGPGHVEITVSATGNPAAPGLAASVVAFSNVASTSLGGGPCCTNSSNSGTGNSTASKTMSGTNRGDALVNSVCTRWPDGAAPGMPTADPVGDPEMVPRTFLALPSRNMQHFAGTSPGADVDPPDTGPRSLRWLQSGVHAWALVGMMLFATDGQNPPRPDAGSSPTDAGAPLDVSAPLDTSAPVDMGQPVDRAPSPVDLGSPAGTGGAQPVPDPGRDANPPDDNPPVNSTDADWPTPNDGPAAVDRRSDDTVVPVPDAGSRATTVGAWRVGCACDLGGGHAVGGALHLAVALALAWVSLRSKAP
jgi:hypothetical protein